MKRTTDHKKEIVELAMHISQIERILKQRGHKRIKNVLNALPMKEWNLVRRYFSDIGTQTTADASRSRFVDFGYKAD